MVLVTTVEADSRGDIVFITESIEELTLTTYLPEGFINDVDGNTYYINDTSDGFQCDLWAYYFDDLEDIASQLYDEMHGNVTDIRIE